MGLLRGDDFPNPRFEWAEAKTYAGTEMATEAAATVREAEERAAAAMGVEV